MHFIRETAALPPVEAFISIVIVTSRRAGVQTREGRSTDRACDHGTSENCSWG